MLITVENCVDNVQITFREFLIKNTWLLGENIHNKTLKIRCKKVSIKLLKAF